MIKETIFKTGLALAAGLGLALALLWALNGSAEPVAAAPPSRPLQGAGDVYCVAPISQAYAGCTRVFTSVQYAVDAATGGEVIKVAEGTYTDVHRRSNMTQVVRIDVPITIRGGYTTTDNFADPPDPTAQTTTLDAGGQGRVIYVSNVTLTLEGLRITDGKASNGGGIYASATTTRSLVISGCHVYSNTAHTNGGGIYLTNSYFPTLKGNQIHANSAGNSGGGMYLNLQTYPVPTLTGNDLYSNTASFQGGGIFLAGGTNATLADNHIYRNTITSGTDTGGGGVHLANNPMAILTGNHVYLNTCNTDGGGMALRNSDQITLENNVIYSNTTADQGGALYLVTVPTSTLLNNQVYSNVADTGGGIYLAGGNNTTLTGNDVYLNAASTDGGGIVVRHTEDATARDNRVYSNTARQDGGGIALASNHYGIVIEENDVYDNTARQYGGGIYSDHSPTSTLAHNRIFSNTALDSGGGIYCSTGHASVLTANDVHQNSGGGGGGIVLYSSDDVALAGNRIYANTAITYNAGGLATDYSTGLHLVNNVIVDNRALTADRTPGILISRSSADFVHTTVARNTGGSGVGLGIVAVEIPSTAILTNTILVSHAVGLKVWSGATATLETTLWGDGEWANQVPVINDGTVFSTTNLAGNPAFVDPSGGDYHITWLSAAHDQGTTTTTSDDVDGDTRPFGAGPDVGADEAACHVRMNGTDYPTVQAAVDASTAVTDVVQVAGTCRGVETRSSTEQIAYISKTLTLRGGYSADFATWDPATYPATLDAEEQGHVLWIAGTAPGSITPTLEGLHVVNGRTSQGGAGIYSRFADTIISGCHVYSNTATGNNGGGILIEYGPHAQLTDNRIHDNRAPLGYGGGLYLHQGFSATLRGNRLIGNAARYGGGVLLLSSHATMANNVVADNVASDWGSGVYVYNSSPRLLHTTIARNTDGDGSGIYIRSSSGGYTANLTNTILVGHEVGITITAGNTASLAATLWGADGWLNDVPWGGDGQVFTATDVTGDPAFADPAGGDYHLGAGSAALDRGLPTGVATDGDGDPREIGLAPDLGADEALVEMTLSKSGAPWVNQGSSYVYTLIITSANVGNAANVVLTDALPSLTEFLYGSHGATVTANSVVTWPVFTVVGGETVTRTFTVKASSAITNSDYRATAVGLSGVAGTPVVTAAYNTTVADAGSNQSAHSGPVTLDGSASYDPQGHGPLEYQWLQQGGNPTPVMLNGADTSVVTFTAPTVVGHYWFTLIVTDALGARDSDTIRVQVTNDPPAADAGEPQQVGANTVTMLDGSGSSDPDGDDLIYGWEQAGGWPVTVNDPTSVQATFAAPTTTGMLTFSLTVTDTFGVSHSDVTTVTVNHAIYLPAVLRE